MCKYCEGSYYTKQNDPNHRELIGGFEDVDKFGNLFGWSIFIDEEENDALAFLYSSDTYDLDYQNCVPVNYCPMCGRKL